MFGRRWDVLVSDASGHGIVALGDGDVEVVQLLGSTPEISEIVEVQDQKCIGVGVGAVVPHEISVLFCWSDLVWDFQHLWKYKNACITRKS